MELDKWEELKRFLQAGIDYKELPSCQAHVDAKKEQNGGAVNDNPKPTVTIGDNR